MGDPIVKSSDLQAFAHRVVNLSRDEAANGRDRVNFLRERLEKHIADNPGFSLEKMLHAGSVAKGTGLASTNDLDTAVYVRADAAPETDLVRWMTDRLREVYGDTVAPDAIQAGTHCPTVTFASGFSIDVVPVLYEGDEDDKGYLVAKDTGEKLLTSVKLHLEFVRSRKKQHPDHFAQLVRYLKWWIRERKAADPDFKFKSFMAELLVAHLADDGLDLTDHTTALAEVFNYIVDSNLAERITFSDYYGLADLPPAGSAPIEIFDPVNPQNNVAVHYTSTDRDRIATAAEDALDAITEAGYATTKAQAVARWQVVLGTRFKG